MTLYRAQRRGGKGKTGMKTKEEDFVEQLFIASTKDYLLFFTDAGRVYWLKVYEIPEGSRATKGKAIVNLVNVSAGEKITTILPVKEFSENTYLIMATQNGVVKKTSLVEYSNVRSGGIIAVNLDEGDKLISVALTDGSQGHFPCIAERQSDTLQRGGCPPDGTRHPRGARHEPRQG